MLYVFRLRGNFLYKITFLHERNDSQLAWMYVFNFIKDSTEISLNVFLLFLARV